jgi:hypothetical protein
MTCLSGNGIVRWERHLLGQRYRWPLLTMSDGIYMRRDSFERKTEPLEMKGLCFDPARPQHYS